MKNIILFIILFSISGFGFSNDRLPADTTRNIFAKGLDQIKLQKARHLYMTADYEGALFLYKQLAEKNPNNALISYRIGEAFLAVRDYQNAANYIDKALRLSTDVHKDLRLNYGQALHRLGELDKAMQQYKLYKESLEEKQEFELNDVAAKMQQVQTAKMLMKNELKVSIKNAGDAINTVYDEYGPSIYNGSQLIFSSRRPDTKGGRKDPFDGKYLEDIYTSTWDGSKWSKAEPIEGRLNTEDHDGCLGISSDGQEIFVYRNMGEAGNGAGDIYVARLGSSGKWGTAKRIEDKSVNTTYFESSASMTADRNKLFFISERKDGLGQSDIYMVERLGRNEWGPATNLGGTINTDNDERMVFVHPDGHTLFFSSNGHNTMGGYDIFQATWQDTGWSKPVNIGYPVNTVNDEVNFSLTPDGKTAYTSGFKPGGFGGLDIYEIDFSNHPLIDEKLLQAKIILKGVVRDETKKPVAGCTLELMDKANNNKVINAVTTNNKGEYQFSLEPHKTYRYQVKKSGFITVESTDIKAGSEKEINKDIILKK